MGTVWSSQSQSVQFENALQVSEQHFDLLAQPSRCSTVPGPGNLTRSITGMLMDRARHFSSGRVWATPWSQCLGMSNSPTLICTTKTLVSAMPAPVSELAHG